MQKERTPYCFLDRSVNLLIADDDPAVSRMLGEVFEAFPMYNIESASSTRKALTLMEPPKRFHACILDLGLDDVKGDEFLLLRRYGHNTCFVVLTASASPAKGFMSARLGAKALMEKSGKIDHVALIKTINRYALLNVINPLFVRSDQNRLSHSTDVLFRKSPAQVTEWALELGISDRELRHIWKRHLGANAKIILFIYHVFHRALVFYENRFIDTLSGKHIHGADEIIDRDEYARHEEYFYLHRSTILDYLEFGNVVNFQVPDTDLKPSEPE